MKEEKLNYFDPDRSYDHYFINHACDLNIAPKGKAEIVGCGKGIFTVGKHCLYGKEMTEHNFDYALKFFDTYRDQRKFLHISINSAHSFYEKNTEFVDAKIFDFWMEFEKQGHLKNTIV
jgi:Protein of unknown function (DUF229)